MIEQPFRDPSSTASSAKRRSVLPWILLAILLVPLLACAVFSVITVGGVTQVVDLVRDVLDGGELVVRDPNPAVITQVQELGRLETASYTVEKVIEGSVEQDNEVLNFFLGDRLLLVAHGEVIAGVDMTQLGEADVNVDETRTMVTLRLPPARILVYKLDNEQSYVYDRRQGLLTRGDPQLESEVRRQAEQRILQAACQGGILAQAAQNAQRQVEALLRAMEFQQVAFLTSEGGQDSGCP